MWVGQVRATNRDLQPETSTRVLSGLFLLAFAAAVGAFAYLNNQPISVDLFGQVKEVPVPTLVGGVYLLGMFTGWAVVGLLRRSWRRVVEDGRQ